MEPDRTNKRLPKFFKVFTPRLSSASLKIPDAWVQHLNALPKNVVLQNRSGKVWHMKMENADNRVYFASGWQQFVKDNSLVSGDFLVFQYNDDNGFNVKILAKSGCEKNETGPHVGIDIEEEEEEEEHEITDEVGRKEEEMEEEALEGTATLKQKKAKGFVKMMCKERTSRELDNVLTREELVPSYVLRDFRIKLAEDVTFHDDLEREWSGEVMRWKDGRTWITGWGSVYR
ncbi:hypothetical protein Pint_34526 [Pistacia integerrima]|uniref:Uncharacterized protein n=1 Tax=Pistacia integerrima TaxID=434235 RepID=A0ACC0X7J4_9ROSI|nr:hypothetical protein Pint_34526 [Pistacia integerrima]